MSLQSANRDVILIINQFFIKSGGTSEEMTCLFLSLGPHACTAFPH